MTYDAAYLAWVKGVYARLESLGKNQEDLLPELSAQNFRVKAILPRISELMKLMRGVQPQVPAVMEFYFRKKITELVPGGHVAEIAVNPSNSGFGALIKSAVVRMNWPTSPAMELALADTPALETLTWRNAEAGRLHQIKLAMRLIVKTSAFGNHEIGIGIPCGFQFDVSGTGKARFLAFGAPEIIIPDALNQFGFIRLSLTHTLTRAYRQIDIEIDLPSVPISDGTGSYEVFSYATDRAIRLFLGAKLLVAAAQFAPSSALPDEIHLKLLSGYLVPLVSKKVSAMPLARGSARLSGLSLSPGDQRIHIDLHVRVRERGTILGFGVSGYANASARYSISLRRQGMNYAFVGDRHVSGIFDWSDGISIETPGGAIPVPVPDEVQREFSRIVGNLARALGINLSQTIALNPIYIELDCQGISMDEVRIRTGDLLFRFRAPFERNFGHAVGSCLPS